MDIEHRANGHPWVKVQRPAKAFAQLLKIIRANEVKVLRRTDRTAWVAALTFGVMVLHSPAHSQEPVISTSDVERFFKVYDTHNGILTADIIQREYLDQASPGLIEFAKLRRVTADSIAKKVKSDPALYADARKCAETIPRVRARLGDALGWLMQLYPQAKMAPLTIVVGHGRPVGVGNPSGAYIGLEALCAWSVPNPDVEDRFVHVLAHEYAHVQQPLTGKDDEKATVLAAALIEGGAEFVAELISGSVAYQHLSTATRGKEHSIETDFIRDIDSAAIGSKWVYNGLGTREAPGDLGYWVGYRICKAYYLNAIDKRKALEEIIKLSDPNAILTASGWKPGVILATEVPIPR